jgi:hypothetical protein
MQIGIIYDCPNFNQGLEDYLNSYDFAQDEP